MIKVLLRSILCLAAASVLLPASATANDLTPGEIQDELVGRSIVWWQEGGWFQGHLALAPDGSAEITVDDPQPDGDVGRWAIRGGEICTEWGEIRDGAEKCYSVRRAAPGRFITSGGNVFEVREAGV